MALEQAANERLKEKHRGYKVWRIRNKNKNQEAIYVPVTCKPRASATVSTTRTPTYPYRNQRIRIHVAKLPKYPAQSRHESIPVREQARANKSSTSQGEDSIWSYAGHCPFHWKGRAPFTSRGKIRAGINPWRALQCDMGLAGAPGSHEHLVPRRLTTFKRGPSATPRTIFCS